MNSRTSDIITSLFVLSSIFHIFFGIGHGHTLETISKIIPIMVLITGILLSNSLNVRILFALVFSLCGDIASKLYLPSGLPFLLQIAFFACAQVCYISEWLRYAPHHSRRTYSVVLPFFVGFYAILLLGNLISACLQKRPQRLRFVIGAAIFIISDSLIFVRMLTGGFLLDGQLIMLTYYTAQYILTSSYWKSI